MSVLTQTGRSLPKREKRALVLTWTDLPQEQEEGGGATSFKNREKAALEPQLPETRPQRPIYRPGRIPLDARAVWCCFWGPMSPKAPSSGLKPAF